MQAAQQEATKVLREPFTDKWKGVLKYDVNCRPVYQLKRFDTQEEAQHWCNNAPKNKLAANAVRTDHI